MANPPFQLETRELGSGRVDSQPHEAPKENGRVDGGKQEAAGSRGESSRRTRGVSLQEGNETVFSAAAAESSSLKAPWSSAPSHGTVFSLFLGR